MGTIVNTVTYRTQTINAIVAGNVNPWKDITISINQNIRKTSGLLIN
jgi:hypothetical protein